MKITILGSGSFISSLDRFGPAYLLETDNKKILIDTGSGVQIRLLELGVKLEDLDYIFITHFHPDHTTDLISIITRYKMLTRQNQAYENKLEIYGPTGVEKFCDKLFEVYDLPQFISSPGPKISQLTTMKTFDGFTVEPFKTEHLGVAAQSYRFNFNGTTVTFSGDTTKSDGILAAAKEADFLVIDSSLNKDEQPIPHLNTTQIGEICKEVGVHKVILSHILDYNKQRDLVAEVKEVWDGDVVLAKDLMEISL